MNFCYNGCRRVWHKTRRGKRHRFRGLLHLPLWDWARQYVGFVSEVATHNSVETVTALLYSQRCAWRPDYLRGKMRQMHTSHSKQGNSPIFAQNISKRADNSKVCEHGVISTFQPTFVQGTCTMGHGRQHISTSARTLESSPLNRGASRGLEDT